MAQSETIDSLGFSVAQMRQDELVRIIRAAAPKLRRMSIDMAESAEKRLDLQALRQAAEAKSIESFAGRNKNFKKL